MHGRRAPALLPDDLVPGKADARPELLDDPVEDVEVRRVIGRAGDVAVAEVQHAVGCEAHWHGLLAVLSGTPESSRGHRLRGSSLISRDRTGVHRVLFLPYIDL